MATILSIGQSNNKEFFCNKKFGKRDFLCLFCLPTHSICFMKSCHFRKTGEQGKLKEKKRSQTKYGDIFPVKCYFLMSETGKKTNKPQIVLTKNILFLTNLSVRSMCIYKKIL